jgi:hypothetical protein
MSLHLAPLSAPAKPDPGEEERRWTWRNLRECDIGFHIVPMPWQWRMSADLTGGYVGAFGHVQFGPFVLTFEADVGNCSTGDWRAMFGLSEQEAWERSKPVRGK